MNSENEKHGKIIKNSLKEIQKNSKGDIHIENEFRNSPKTTTNPIQALVGLFRGDLLRLNVDFRLRCLGDAGQARLGLKSRQPILSKPLRNKSEHSKKCVKR